MAVWTVGAIGGDALNSLAGRPKFAFVNLTTAAVVVEAIGRPRWESGRQVWVEESWGGQSASVGGLLPAPSAPCRGVARPECRCGDLSTRSVTQRRQRDGGPGGPVRGRRWGAQRPLLYWSDRESPPRACTSSAVPQFPNERDSRWHLVVGGAPTIPKKDGVCWAFDGLSVSFGIVGDCPNESVTIALS